MAVITREDVTPSPITNARVQKAFVDGDHRRYEIQPLDGYVLHDNRLDFAEIDPETLEETPKPGFTAMYVTCRFDYDFEANPFEFYTVPADNVPADQIFGGGDNDHEIA